MSIITFISLKLTIKTHLKKRKIYIVFFLKKQLNWAKIGYDSLKWNLPVFEDNSEKNNFLEGGKSPVLMLASGQEKAMR